MCKKRKKDRRERRVFRGEWEHKSKNKSNLAGYSGVNPALKELR